MQASEAIVQLAARGQHQDPARVVFRTQPPQHFETIHSGKTDIEDDEVEGRLVRLEQSGFAFMHDHRVVTGFSQRRGNVARQSYFIINDQDVHRDCFTSDGKRVKVGCRDVALSAH